VITVSEEGRLTLFETDDRWRETTFTGDSAFIPMMAGSERILAVVPAGEVDAIGRSRGEPVVVLARDSRYALITNRPTPAERARVSDRLPARAARSGPTDP
jgi:hypothetical protein